MVFLARKKGFVMVKEKENIKKKFQKKKGTTLKVFCCLKFDILVKLGQDFNSKIMRKTKKLV